MLVVSTGCSGLIEGALRGCMRALRVCLRHELQRLRRGASRGQHLLWAQPGLGSKLLSGGWCLLISVFY